MGCPPVILNPVVRWKLLQYQACLDRAEFARVLGLNSNFRKWRDMANLYFKEAEFAARNS
jgi:hypothetical protein